MAKPSKLSSPGRRQPKSGALRQFQAALGLEGEAWRTFLVLARKGFADYESAPLPRMELEVGSIGLRLMLPGLQRRAVRALVETVGEPPLEVIKEFLLRPERNYHYVDMVHQGALDVVQARSAELGPEKVRKLLRKAIKQGTATVRQAAYRIGLEQFGSKFAHPALKDPAKVVSHWAVKALATEASKPRR